mmetsp:Transcript_44404/g.79628  ORF Transcript_44404/g.79628 Transcript_44404/m.79628 type:complete len:287 (+) Transcript_44404:119-979(+)
MQRLLFESLVAWVLKIYDCQLFNLPTCSDELLVQRPGCRQPSENDEAQNDTQVGSGDCKGSQTEDQTLLNKRPSRLAQRISDNINGSLTLCTGLSIQRDVGHFLARVEQRILSGLGHNVLQRANKHRQHERGGAKQSSNGVPQTRRENQGEEDQPSDTKDGGGNSSSRSPAELLEDLAADEHHEEGHSPSGRGEIAHESTVRVRVRELRLQLRLPGHLNNVDTHTIANHQQSQITNVRTLCEERSTLLHCQLCLGLGQLLLAGVNTIGIRDHTALNVGVARHQDCS